METVQLYPHQTEGVQWMKLREQSEIKGGLLCDDPGLGKTFQILTLIKQQTINEHNEHNLIICPLSLIQTWVNAIRTIFPTQIIQIHYSNTKLTTLLQFKKTNPFITITTYTNTWKHDDTPTILHHIQWTRIICDEAHVIKNIKSKVASACHSIQATYRWAITGTPIHNKLKDIHALLYYIHAHDSDLKLIRQNLHQLTTNYILRRTKDIMDLQYNKLTVNIIHATFINNEEKDFYYTIKKAITQELKHIQTTNKQQYNIQVLELITRLRQASIHPYIIYKALLNKIKGQDTPEQYLKLKQLYKYWKHIPTTKIQTLIKHLSINQFQQDKVIIFTHFKEETNIILKYIQEELSHLQTYVYNGDTPISQREQILLLCKQNKVDILIIQIMAGGVGLNLQMFSKIYITSPDWNPANEIQAIARCHRIGQPKHVQVFKIILADNDKPTIEQHIIQLQSKKRYVMSQTLRDPTLLFNEIDQHTQDTYKPHDTVSIQTIIHSLTEE